MIIEFEDETQIIIYAETKAQLKQLNDYNINQIVSDLNNAVGGKELPDYYHIKNNSGKRYLKDSTLIYESGKNFKIRMGNVTLEIDGLKEDQSLEDKWYELADEFSNWHFEGADKNIHYDSIEGFTRTSRAYYKKKPWISDLKRYSYDERSR